MITFAHRGARLVEPESTIPAFRRALDVGASTGGFTDCLLQRGAAHVVALDVAYGELAWRLRNDPRWRFFELSTGHNLHYTAPQATVALLLELANAPVAAAR